MADLLRPRAYNCLIGLLLRRAVGGRPCRRPARWACTIPAFTRSRRISRSNSAKTANSPARARPVEVVRSKASVREMKPTLSSVNSFNVVTRSASERPQRSKRHTRIASSSRRRAASLQPKNCVVFCPPAALGALALGYFPRRARLISRLNRREGHESGERGKGLSEENKDQRVLPPMGGVPEALRRGRLYCFVVSFFLPTRSLL